LETSAKEMINVDLLFNTLVRQIWLSIDEKEGGGGKKKHKRGSGKKDKNFIIL
jgi:hypothetical protein